MKIKRRVPRVSPLRPVPGRVAIAIVVHDGNTVTDAFHTNANVAIAARNGIGLNSETDATRRVIWHNARAIVLTDARRVSRPS